MTQTVPAALVAPSRPSLAVGYLIRALNGTVATAFTTTNVTEQGTATGYYQVTGGVAAPDAGGLLEWYVNNAGSAGAFLSAATIEAMPDNFTAMAITAGGAVTAGTVSDKTGYSLSSTQSFNLTGNITGDLSGSVGSVTGAVGSVTSPVTAGTVSDKTGYSLSSTQNFNLTGNVTGNLSGSVGSVTGAVGSVTSAVTVGTNNDKTGYSLTQTFPANFPDLAITASTGQVTVGTLANNAITAAAIATDAIDADAIAASAVTEVQAGLATQASVNSIPTTPAPTAAQNAAATWTYTTGDRLLTGSQATEIAKIQGVRDKTDNLPSDPADQSLLIDAINTRASQTSVDAIPTTAAPTAAQNASQVRTELTTELARIDATISSRLASSGYTTPPTTGQIRTELATELARIDVATSTRLAAADYTAPPTAAQTATQVRTELGTELARIDTSISSRSTLTAAQIRAELATELGRLDVAVSSRSTLTAGDIPAGLSAQQVWEYATRQLTGTQASNLAAIPNIPTNPLLASAYTPPPSAATIADAVWDETLSQHLTAGSTGAKLNLASTLTVGDIPAGLSAQQVWEYATRTLSVASGLTNAQEIKLNELHRKAGLDPAVPVTRTLNPATGNVAETFTGVAINHVEAGTTVVTTRQP